jgi:putative nucleotidyltransferase with HDIG domain
MKELYDLSYLLLNKYVKLKRLQWHAYATEAIMKDLAVYLNEDKDKWGIAGLLHDLDIEFTYSDVTKHTLETKMILNNLNFPDEIIDAICMHNEKASKQKRSEKFHFALSSSDALSGFIAFVISAKHFNKINELYFDSVYECLLDNNFAKHYDKTPIFEYKELNVDMKTFINIGINAMKKVSNKIGFNN